MLFNKGIGGWLLSKRIHKIAKHYDLAVDYNGQHQLYYLVDFVKATKKVTFFHNDYSKWNYYYSMDQKYYSKVDKIYTVSETCVDALKMYFPNDGSKIELFENISSLKLINELALFPFEGLEEFSFVTVGHLTERKGTRLAIEVAHILKNKGLKFHWYFIGKDTEDHNYNQLVKLKKLEKNIHFVGVLPNPYPYIKNATIMVHLASYEGKSIALDEAKILCKPIVVTNFSTVNDQFQNGYNASIVSFNAHEIAETLLELVNNPSLQQQYSQNLRNDCKDNSHEIEKLYHLIN
jgi:glycosyltransferase involved in cell wall biosynthesis